MDLHYTYRGEWSPKDGEHLARCLEFPSLSFLAPTVDKAMAGIVALVEEVVTDMQAHGEIPPTPLGDRRYGGEILVRTSESLHRRLTIEAAEQGVSLNQWAVQKLAQ